MKALSPAQPALVACAALLASGTLHAQARGPTAEYIRENGQELRDYDKYEKKGALDEATRAQRVAELQPWLRRLAGRFRIDGQVDQDLGPGLKKGTRISGVADCAAVGDGPGVHCMIDATWPPIFLSAPFGYAPLPSGSERRNAFKPAVMVIGFGPDPPVVRVQLVGNDTRSQMWTATLHEDIASSPLIRGCGECGRPFEITARPDSDIVTFVFRAGSPGSSGSYSITFIMHRDPLAGAKRIKPSKLMPEPKKKR